MLSVTNAMFLVSDTVFYQVNILFNIVFVKDAVWAGYARVYQYKSFWFLSVYRRDGWEEEGIAANHSADQRNFPEFGRVYREIRCPGFPAPGYDCDGFILSLYLERIPVIRFFQLLVSGRFLQFIFNNDLLLVAKFVVGISKGGDTLCCGPVTGL